MSSVDAGLRARPLRLAGIVLLGVAAVATVLGLITLGFDGDGSAATPDPPAETTPDGTSPAEPTTPTTPTGAVTTTPTTPPGPTTTPQRTTEPPRTTTGKQDSGDRHNVRVRVYNNSTITGHAAKAAKELRRAGWSVDEVGNYSAGIIPTSTVYYRPGTPEQAAARDLGNQFDLRIEPRFRGIKDAEPGLIVIVTNDFGTK